MNTAQSLILANVLSEYSTGLNLWNFITSDESSGFTTTSSAGRVTLNELISRGNKVHFGTDKTEFQIIWENMKTNGWRIAGSMVLIPVGFNVAKKLLAKPIIRPANKALKMANLKDVKLG